MVSKVEHDHLSTLNRISLDPENDDLIITFQGLVEKTDFIEKVRTIMDVLQESLKSPVDIEFASDGETFYLLQCRPQSYGDDDLPSPIPRDIPRSAILFEANKYVTNGRVPDITHIVYVDPDGYAKLEERSQMQAVGRAVGQLNKSLPKRQFILIGPGRWGSRGDIKLGVPVTYSDINNTAMLIEVARQRGNYVPDLSFGTHFFQDLVEAGIRYLPLYPDDDKILQRRFPEPFLQYPRRIAA